MPIQIVGLSCALCDRKIVADPDGRICPGCGSVFHTSCIESKSCPDCHITIESAVSHDATRAPYVAVYHPERPWSVTLVGRLVCIGSIAIPFDFATSSTNTDSTVDFCGFPLPISMRLALAIIEGVILFAIGISILDGSNRARWIYIGLGAIGAARIVAVGYFSVYWISAMLVYLACTSLLLTRSANEYFNPIKFERADAPGHDVG